MPSRRWKPARLTSSKNQLRSRRTICFAFEEKVKAAANVAVHSLTALEAKKAAIPVKEASRVKAVVIGVSTGGPQALRALLPRFPESFPVPIVMVLHMPVGFTALYATKLNEICALEVREAAEGNELRPGLSLLAPAGRHLKLMRSASGRVVSRLAVQPIESLHRPSVDVLFHSAAEIFGPNVLGVVMTGMGSDGREGSAWIKAKGGMVLTEAEESCVIYGMPRSVVEAGLSDAAVPLPRLAEAIIERL